MPWLAQLKQFLPQHKYAINAQQLGDFSQLPWSNLGDWSALTTNSRLTYPQACQNLAQRLADTLNLNSNDRLLDLGCGQGASLAYWQQAYGVKHIEGVELQLACVEKIRQQLPHLTAIHCLDFLNLNFFEFKKFDVVMCIDAAYHVPLNSFLDSALSVLNSKGRIGFHLLIWSDQFLNSNILTQQKYRWLLRAADIQSADVMTKEQLLGCLEDRALQQVELQDLSEAVLGGFASYIEQQAWQGNQNLDRVKIAMTAKLCRSLYNAGMVHYVQVTAWSAE